MRMINSRKLCEIDMEVLRKEVSDRLDVDQSDDVDTMALSYDSTLRTLLDAHAPEKSHVISLRPKAPWYSESLRRAKAETGKAERKWLKSRLSVDKDILLEKCRRQRQT